MNAFARNTTSNRMTRQMIDYAISETVRTRQHMGLYIVSRSYEAA